MATLQEKTSDISVIVINYKTWETTISLLNLIKNCPEIEIIVIDNGPTDILKDKIVNLDKKIRYFLLEGNKGYAKAVNEGIKNANGKWIMVLNNDIETSCKNIIKLKEFAEQENFLVVAPQLKGKNNEIQNSVGYFDNWQKHFVNAVFARPRFINASSINKKTYVDLAIGGAILFDKQVFEKIGMWDERFFMYFEDIDFCYRLYKEKIKILYTPEVQFLHYGSLTASKNLEEKKLNYETAKSKYIKKNRGNFLHFLNNVFKFF